MAEIQHTQQKQNNVQLTSNTILTPEHALPLYRLPEFKKVYKLSLPLKQKKIPEATQLKELLNTLKTKEAVPLVRPETLKTGQKNLPATEVLKAVATLLEQPKVKELNPEKQQKKALQKALQLLTTLLEQAQEQKIAVAERQATATKNAVAHGVVNDVPPALEIATEENTQAPEPEQEAYIEASTEQGYSKGDSWDTATGEASSTLETSETQEAEPVLQKGTAAPKPSVKTSGQNKATKGKKKAGFPQKLSKLFGKAWRMFKGKQRQRKSNTTREVIVVSQEMLRRFTVSPSATVAGLATVTSSQHRKTTVTASRGVKMQ